MANPSVYLLVYSNELLIDYKKDYITI